MSEEYHNVMEMAVEMSGSILRQAEWERNFTKTYTRVFEKIVELQYTGDQQILQILGNVGE